MVNYKSVLNSVWKSNTYKVVLIFLCFSFTCTTDAMLPIKGCVSLKEFKKLHMIIAEQNIKVQSVKLSEKFSAIDHLEKSLFDIIKDIKDGIKSNSDLISRLDKPFMVSQTVTKKNLESYLSQLQKRMKDINTEINTVLGKTVDLSSGDISSISPVLIEYRDTLVKKMQDGIDRGDYSPLLSSFPTCLFVIAHVPNTFTCAFTLKTAESLVDIFVKNGEKVLTVTSNPGESCVFESGDADEDFFKPSLLVQTASLCGSILDSKMKSVSNTPADLYRHSEQKSFRQLGVVDFLDAFISCVDKPVLEIIYHGNTLRDMCSNCRATLIAHEMLATRNVLVPDAELPDSFLCALQNAFFEKFKKKPGVTCLISSFVEYDNRKKDPTWSEEPPINLLDPSVKAPKGICPGFLNQFAFTEKTFLEKLAPALESKIKDGSVTGQAIIEAIRSRLSKI